MKIQKSKLYLYPAIIGLVLIIGILIYFFLVSVSVKEDIHYIYIDDDDTQDSVVNKIRPIASSTSIICLQNLLRHTGYKDYIKTGRYAINPGEGIVTIYRRLKNGQQSSLNLTIPESRTMDKLAAVLGKKPARNTVTILAPSLQCSYPTPMTSTGMSALTDSWSA